MKTYQIAWVIDIEAGSANEAVAKLAAEIQHGKHQVVAITVTELDDNYTLCHETEKYAEMKVR